MESGTTSPHERSVPWPTIDAEDIAWLSTEQMVEVDRVMVEDLHIELVQMMENAGRNLARVALTLWNPERAVVVAGTGGNGGGGLVAARHLANAGVTVSVALSKPAASFRGVPAHQLDIVQRLGVPVVDGLSAIAHADLVVDALIGYSLRGAPRGRSAELIEAIGAASVPVISLDVPSGVDTSTGAVPGVQVRADVTLTLALPKRGLRSRPDVGRLFVGDISVPASVYDGLGVTPSPDQLFRQSPVREITTTRHR